MTHNHKTYASLAEIKAENNRVGHHWFSPATVEWFGTDFYEGVKYGRYFITSEQPPYGERIFKVRFVRDDGGIATVGALGMNGEPGTMGDHWPTYEEAEAFLDRAVKAQVLPDFSPLAD